MAGNEVFNDLNLVLQLNQHIQEVSATADGDRLPASPSGSLPKQTSFKVLTNLESVSYSEVREDAQFDHQRSVFLSVSSSDLPFHLQGDRDFNEASAMAKRRALRFSEVIKARVEFLWEVAGGKKQAEMAQRIRQQQMVEDSTGRGRAQSVRRPGAGNGIKELLPPLQELDEEDYVELMLLIFKVLRDDFVLELAYKQIQCDWEVDSHHGKTLSFDQFFAAIFELVDVWTCDMEETTYERFLHLLARRITRRVAVFLDGAELKLSMSDNFEPAVVVKSIPLRTIPRFVAVARVVAATGIKTVGELAQADPKVVERERVSFLQRNNGGVIPEALSEMKKIGQDLQTLLAMFKSIALQFENLTYTLDNNVLRRVPTAAGPRPEPGQETGDSVVRTGGNPERTSVYGEVVETEGTFDVRSLGSASVGGKLPACSGIYERSSTKSDSELRQPQTTTGGSVNGSIDRPNADRNRPGSFAQFSSASGNISTDYTQPNGSRRAVSPSESEYYQPQANTRARGVSDGNFQPINTIHDLQFADAGVLNALRSTFLIEKAISIERQTKLTSIREELMKFGANLDILKSEEAVRDRYNALYDLLVLRDGESLKSLAAVMLEQIKLELSIHGITVEDEEDVEEVYDGFYSSVVNGTGESIVEEAQRWMEGTLQGNKVNDYLQNDFHELKSIDQVKLLGSQRGDEEFLGLLANESEGEDKEAESSSPTARRRSSLIKRKPSRPTVPVVRVVTPQEDHSKASGPVEDSLPHSPVEIVALPVKNETDPDSPSDKKKKVKRKKNGHERRLNTPDPPPVQVPIPTEDTHPAREKEKSIATKRKPKLTISTQENTQPPVIERKPVEKAANLGPPVEAARAATPDDGKRNRTALPSHHSRPTTELEIDAALEDTDHHDTSDQHTARDALNVAIEFEEDESAPGNFISRLNGERPISLEPKMPKIVIGGSSSAKNVPVTGRYIQLLGLGTVLISKTEHDFFKMLRSHESADTDLVCFDIGTELDTAVSKLQTIQLHVGNRVILFGGSTDEPERTQQVALECLGHGALYFAMIPFDFPRLRERIMSFFENSKQPYILRQRKPPGQTAQVGSSIGSGSLFALHDEPRRVSTSVAFAKTPRRKVAVAVPALPSLPQSPRESPQLLPQGLSETRRPDFAPIAPSTPRSSQSKNRSPRFSTAMNKLIR